MYNEYQKKEHTKKLTTRTFSHRDQGWGAAQDGPGLWVVKTVVKTVLKTDSIKDRATQDGPGLWVSFALSIGLFCPICRPLFFFFLKAGELRRMAQVCGSLLPYMQASFAISIGLFCHINRPLLPYMQASFAISIGLFCHICRPLLPYQ
jgi:hypothetical protein